MIKVLQNWKEIGEAILTLQKKSLPIHESAQKNWDHFIIYNTLISKDKNSSILDLGCGEGHTLKLLHALGFSNLYGIDLTINWKLRLSQVYRILKSNKYKIPFNLHKGDLHKTPFKNEYFDYIYSISTIEHGIETKSLLKEVYRILKPNSLFFLTTDYWETKINIDKSIRPFGLQWKIFSREEIEYFISTARETGFELIENTTIPTCSNKTVFWHNAEYTFIALLFKKIN